MSTIEELERTIRSDVEEAATYQRRAEALQRGVTAMEAELARLRAEQANEQQGWRTVGSDGAVAEYRRGDCVEFIEVSLVAHIEAPLRERNVTLEQQLADLVVVLQQKREPWTGSSDHVAGIRYGLGEAIRCVNAIREGSK